MCITLNSGVLEIGFIKTHAKITRLLSRPNADTKLRIPGPTCLLTLKYPRHSNTLDSRGVGQRAQAAPMAPLEPLIRRGPNPYSKPHSTPFFPLLTGKVGHNRMYLGD